MTSKHVWPEQKQLAVSITVLIETWTEGRAPPYSVQTTQLKWGTVDNSAITWAQHGGNEGVWRLLRILNHFGIPGTFAINAKCVELYPEAIKATVRSGHEIAAHGYYQDQLHTYMERGQERNEHSRHQHPLHRPSHNDFASSASQDRQRRGSDRRSDRVFSCATASRRSRPG